MENKHITKLSELLSEEEQQHKETQKYLSSARLLSEEINSTLSALTSQIDNLEELSNPLSILVDKVALCKDNIASSLDELKKARQMVSECEHLCKALENRFLLK